MTGVLMLMGLGTVSVWFLVFFMVCNKSFIMIVFSILVLYFFLH